MARFLGLARQRKKWSCQTTFRLISPKSTSSTQTCWYKVNPLGKCLVGINLYVNTAELRCSCWLRHSSTSQSDRKYHLKEHCEQTMAN
jgi:hypothetical protein